MKKSKRSDGLDHDVLPAIEQAKRGHAIYTDVMDLLEKRFEALPDDARDAVMTMVIGILVEDIERRIGRDNLRVLVDRARDFRDAYRARK